MALPVLDALAGKLDITIGWEPVAEGHDGYYQPGERRIALNQAITVNQQAAALAHELAHAIVRLDHHDDVQQLDCATEELVAESVAYTVCGFLGLDTAGNSIPYLAVWSEHTDADAFERIAALVDRLARRLEEALQPDAAEGRRVRDQRHGVTQPALVGPTAKRRPGWGLGLLGMLPHRAHRHAAWAASANCPGRRGWARPAWRHGSGAERRSEHDCGVVDPRTGTKSGGSFVRTIAVMFIRQLDYLAALDRERHFGRASAACHVSQPTLSAGIRSLERELGIPLVRRGRTFEGLTPEGERVLGWAQRALADLESLRQEAGRLRGGLEGTLRVGAIPTALPLSPRVTARVRERHPRVRVRLTSMTSRRIAYGLAHGQIDAGMTYLDNEPLADVDTLPLWREHYLLVTAAADETVPRGTVPWAAAATLPLCLLTSDMQFRRIVDSAFIAAGAVPEPAVETNSVSALVAHARTGLPGVTAHTWLEANPLPADLLALPLVDPVIEHTIGLVVSNTVERTPVIAELLSMFAMLELEGDAVRTLNG